VKEQLKWANPYTSAVQRFYILGRISLMAVEALAPVAIAVVVVVVVVVIIIIIIIIIM
jgi:hypothetical protein